MLAIRQEELSKQSDRFISREYQQLVEHAKQFIDRQKLADVRVEFDESIFSGTDLSRFGLTELNSDLNFITGLKQRFAATFADASDATWNNLVPFMNEENRDGSSLGILEFFALAASMDKTSKRSGVHHYLMQCIVREATMRGIPVSQLLFSLSTLLGIEHADYTLAGLIRYIEQMGIVFDDQKMQDEFKFIDLSKEQKIDALISLWEDDSVLSEEQQKELNPIIANLKNSDRLLADRRQDLIGLFDLLVHQEIPQKMLAKVQDNQRYPIEHWTVSGEPIQTKIVPIPRERDDNLQHEPVDEIRDDIQEHDPDYPG